MSIKELYFREKAKGSPSGYQLLTEYQLLSDSIYSDSYITIMSSVDDEDDKHKRDLYTINGHINMQGHQPHKVLHDIRLRWGLVQYKIVFREQSDLYALETKFKNAESMFNICDRPVTRFDFSFHSSEYPIKRHYD